MLRKDIERGSYYIVKPETPCRFLVQVIDWDNERGWRCRRVDTGEIIYIKHGSRFYEKVEYSQYSYFSSPSATTTTTDYHSLDQLQSTTAAKEMDSNGQLSLFDENVELGVVD
jgi:hypothetical protein